MNITISKAVSVGLMLFGLGAVVTCLAAESGNAPTEKTICMGFFLGYEIAVSLLGNWEKPSFSHHREVQFRPNVSW